MTDEERARLLALGLLLLTLAGIGLLALTLPEKGHTTIEGEGTFK